MAKNSHPFEREQLTGNFSPRTEYHLVDGEGKSVNKTLAKLLMRGYKPPTKEQLKSNESDI